MGSAEGWHLSVLAAPLLQLELRFKLLARIPLSHRFHRALAAFLFCPELMVLRHVYLGKAKSPFRIGRKTADRLVLQVFEEDSRAGHRGRASIRNEALHHALPQVLRLGRLRRPQPSGIPPGKHSPRQQQQRHSYQHFPVSSPQSSSSSSSKGSSSRSSPTRANSRGSTPTTSYSVPHSSQVTTSPSSTSSSSISSAFSHSG